ncbi:hypothetical protein J6590_062516 [Homalodisca vitripennis]|nr:hypothetical protein J6590_062516 [Homalodisca vitripennis]
MVTRVVRQQLIKQDAVTHMVIGTNRACRTTLPSSPIIPTTRNVLFTCENMLTDTYTRPLQSPVYRRPADQINHTHKFLSSERDWLDNGSKSRQFSDKLFT